MAYNLTNQVFLYNLTFMRYEIDLYQIPESEIQPKRGSHIRAARWCHIRSSKDWGDIPASRIALNAKEKKQLEGLGIHIEPMLPDDREQIVLHQAPDDFVSHSPKTNQDIAGLLPLFQGTKTGMDVILGEAWLRTNRGIDHKRIRQKAKIELHK
jgi:hypothetical protein